MAADPDRWYATTDRMYYDILGAVPPAAMGGCAFLLVEISYFNSKWEDVYACFRDSHGRYAARYMTAAEFYKYVAAWPTGE